jgi:hypothetical protein
MVKISLLLEYETSKALRRLCKNMANQSSALPKMTQGLWTQKKDLGLVPSGLEPKKEWKTIKNESKNLPKDLNY